MLFCFGLCNKTFWNKWQKIHYDNTNYCRNVIINGIPHMNAKGNVIAKRRKSDCTMRRWGLDQGYMTLILIQYISHITLYCSKLIYIYIMCAIGILSINLHIVSWVAPKNVLICGNDIFMRNQDSLSFERLL